ncbi:hypothetical protein PCANC_28731 [Puccinia coronata f. sp. avenae]|uniref:Uncharacterized protein n=1 Tax=Puccinia coronata f. sp. avenae TaxID=200324 RepID=A0A2N5TLM5_9BASI|nr:hypothetical protein PCASD_24772 [Puccinia coronata f. sp. avenae]PLW26409.1 hypothetical protein PCANC_28731 [Puccinia coronata f. sp. avenae]
MASSATHERRRLKVKYPQRVNGDHSEPERVSLILILGATGKTAPASAICMGFRPWAVPGLSVGTEAQLPLVSSSILTKCVRMNPTRRVT